MFRCLLLDALVLADELALVDGLVLELQAASMSAAAASAAARRGVTGMDGTAGLLVPAHRVSGEQLPEGMSGTQMRSQGRPVLPDVCDSRRCHGPVQR